ncbi:SWIM zinc finger family protein [Brachybacterium huguangmaarense]
MSITLRSRRGAIGVQWHAVALRERLEGQMGGGRAAAGRRAARAGSVDWIDVTPGTVRGQVRDAGGATGADGDAAGSGVDAAGTARPRLDVRPLGSGDRALLLELARARPDLATRLVAGEYPASFDAELVAAGLALLPSGPAEITHDCSCLDWPGPCVHVAALAYVLVEAVDARPALLLELRGIALEDIAPAPGGSDGATDRRAPGATADPDVGTDGPDPGAGGGDAGGPTGTSDADEGPGDGSEVDSEAVEGDDGDGPDDEGPEDDTARFDPTRADATLLIPTMGPGVAAALALFYGARPPTSPTSDDASD